MQRAVYGRQQLMLKPWTHFRKSREGSGHERIGCLHFLCSAMVSIRQTSEWASNASTP